MSTTNLGIIKSEANPLTGTRVQLNTGGWFIAESSAVQKSKIESNKTQTITQNGTVEITPSSGKEAMAKVTVTVNVPAMPTRLLVRGHSVINSEDVTFPSFSVNDTTYANSYFFWTSADRFSVPLRVPYSEIQIDQPYTTSIYGFANTGRGTLTITKTKTDPTAVSSIITFSVTVDSAFSDLDFYIIQTVA